MRFRETSPPSMGISAFTKRALQLAPREVRHAIYRSRCVLSRQFVASLQVKVAETKEELEAAFSLSASPLELCRHHALPSTRTFIATLRGAVVGALTFVPDGPFGLPIDEVGPPHFSRDDGARPAEIFVLALHPVYRQLETEIFFSLFRALFAYCSQLPSITHFVLSADERHADFYESVFFFMRTGAVRQGLRHDGVLVRQVVLAVERSVMRWMMEARMTGPRQRELFHFLFDASPMRDQGVSRPNLSPELLDHFFTKRTDVFARTSRAERKMLAQLYPGEAYRAVLPPPDDEAVRRSEPRFDASLSGALKLGDQKVPVVVKNVSLSGLCAVLKKPIWVGHRIRLKLGLADSTIVTLEVIPRWGAEGGLYGFRILEACDAYYRYVQSVSQ